MTQYVALLYYDKNQYWDSPPEAEFAPDYTEFARRATEAGVMRGGEALHPVTMSTTITVSGGKGGDVLLVDGPYAEAKEVLGGYFLLEAANLDEAVAWAAQNPGAQRSRTAPSAGPSAYRAVRARLTAFLTGLRRRRCIVLRDGA